MIRSLQDDYTGVAPALELLSLKDDRARKFTSDLEVPVLVAGERPGIPVHLLPHLFERFNTGPNARGIEDCT